MYRNPQGYAQCRRCPQVFQMAMPRHFLRWTERRNFPQHESTGSDGRQYHSDNNNDDDDNSDNSSINHNDVNDTNLCRFTDTFPDKLR